MAIDSRLQTLKNSLQTERDNLRAGIASDIITSGGNNVYDLLAQSALLTAKIGELVALGAT